MSNIVRLNQLPEGSGALSHDDIFVFMDDPSGSGITKKISLNEIASAIGGGGSANTGDISFEGIKIIGSGTASGDGNGYATIELVPDNNLYTNDQYLIIDPTGPNHIHLRAGGTQDDSNAEIIVGGENNNVRVNDQFPLARMQTESLTTLNTYYLTSPEFSNVIWETFEGYNRIVINDPTPIVYDAVWALSGNSDSLFSVIDGSGNYYELISNGSSTPGGSNPVMVYVYEAPPVSPTVLTQLTFEIRQSRQTYLEANGNDVKIEAADDVRIYSHDAFRLYNYSSNDPVEIFTDYDDQEYRWAFRADGNLEFPDNSIQNTAYSPYTDIYELNSVSGDVYIDWAPSKQIQKLTLNGTAVTFIKGANWPNSSTQSADVILKITVTNPTTITWSIVTEWYNQPSAGALSVGTHLFLLRSMATVIEGHYIGNKTN